ncbi:T9SS type A sorting domain-containing protein [uncultured Winogradskyella sp.]|uniref:T9SS type A sorting domain-containing protein n=1 Tax=uncultured Winogradskyella sp. TaxID=395353 RepID=UPI0026288DC4|nr:T9SS type A sorting domain-containing protein [uncultured Winogradskyella sp.]
MKKITLLLFLFASFFSVAQSTCNQTFSASGFDDDPTVLTITAAEINCADPETPTALTLNNSAGNLTNTNCDTNGTSNWYDFTLLITGGPSDGVTISGCSGELNGVDITGFTSLTITSAENDGFSDAITITIDVVSTFTPSSAPNCDAMLTQTANLPTTGDISWSPASGGVDGYSVTVGTGSGLNDVYQATLGNVLTTNIGALMEGTTYYVNIIPFNSQGPATGCTEETFTTFQPVVNDTQATAIPIVPNPQGTGCATAQFTLPFDIDGTTDSGVDGSCNGADTGLDQWFTWTATTDGLLFLDTAPGNPGIVIRDTSGTEIDCAQTFTSTATSGAGEVLSGWTIGQDLIIQIYDFSGSTSTVAFCLEEFTLPPAPECAMNPTPADDATNVDVFDTDNRVTLAWEFSTTGETADNYDLLFGTTSGALNNLGTFAANTTIDVTGIDFATEYFWTIVPSNMGSPATGCPEWSFTTEDAPPPPANDLCSGATMVSVGSGTCGTDVTGTNVSATDSGVAQATCATATYAGGDIWYAFMMPMGETELNYTRSASDFSTTQVELYSGDCMTLVEVDCTTSAADTFTGLTGGSIYYLRMYDFNNDDFGDVTFCLGTPPPPSTNTTCATADTITCGETLNGNSSTSMGTSEDSGCAMGVNGLWYTFTGTGLDVTLTSTASFDHRMAIASGDCGTLTNIICDDQSTGAETHTFATTNGETYYVYIAHYLDGNTTTGTISLTLDCATLPNDDCAGAEAIDSGSFGMTIPGTNVGATDSGLTDGCVSGNDVWYSFTAAQDGDVMMTIDAGFEYGFYADCATTTSLACNTNLTSATTGTTYYIRIGDDGSTTRRAPGAFNFSISGSALSNDSFDIERAFTYYPNPVKNTLTINAKQNVESIAMYNMLGQEVIRLSPNSVDTEVDMSSLLSGAYFVKVSIQGATKTIRVIKQ